MNWRYERNLKTFWEFYETVKTASVWTAFCQILLLLGTEKLRGEHQLAIKCDEI